MAATPDPRIAGLPDLPARTWRLAGPGLVAAGGGGSGELVLWPYIASQAGLVFLWAAVAGIAVQWLLNTEVERYALATGETALSGFGPRWGVALVALAYAANLWPAWATASATVLTYLFGSGDPRWLAVAVLLAIGVVLTFAPVVYVMLERLVLAKLAALGLLAVLAVVFVIRGHTWAALGSAPRFPSGQLGTTLLLGAMAYAGGARNLAQGNWIRDKGYGMGLRKPRLTSALASHERYHDAAARVVPAGELDLARWRRWWRFANVEQAVAFGGVSLVSVVFVSMLAHASVFGSPAVQNATGFLKVEGLALQALAGGWFGYLFWAVAAIALFVTATGITDYTSRLAADLVKTRFPRSASESVLYLWLVWALVGAGVLVLALGRDQPVRLLTVSAWVASATTAVYSLLLYRLNTRSLPPAIGPGRARALALVLAGLAFAGLAAVTVQSSVGGGP